MNLSTQELEARRGGIHSFSTTQEFEGNLGYLKHTYAQSSHKSSSGYTCLRMCSGESDGKIPHLVLYPLLAILKLLIISFSTTEGFILSRASLYNPDWFQSHSPPAMAPGALGLQVGTVTFGQVCVLSVRSGGIIVHKTGT